MTNKIRLIDANALLEHFQFRISSESLASHSAYIQTISDCVEIARKLISEAPTVDAVEVVRCKDCKHYVLHALACRCENFNGIIRHDGFCSYGERKDNETTE